MPSRRWGWGGARGDSCLCGGPGTGGLPQPHLCSHLLLGTRIVGDRETEVAPGAAERPRCPSALELSPDTGPHGSRSRAAV